MTMDRHTPGPVRVVEMFGNWCVRNTSGVVAHCPLTGLENGKEVAAANARRIAATWNACEEAGLSTAALEAGVVREMVEAITEIVDHCDWQDEHHPDGRAVEHKLHYSIADNLRHILAKVRGEA